VLQMIIQGVWFDQCALINIPYFTAEIIGNLRCSYLCEVVDLLRNNQLDRLLEKECLNHNEIEEIKTVLQNVPVV